MRLICSPCPAVSELVPWPRPAPLNEEGISSTADSLFARATSACDVAAHAGTVGPATPACAGGGATVGGSKSWAELLRWPAGRGISELSPLPSALLFMRPSRASRRSDWVAIPRSLSDLLSWLQRWGYSLLSSASTDRVAMNRSRSRVE